MKAEGEPRLSRRRKERMISAAVAAPVCTVRTLVLVLADAHAGGVVLLRALCLQNERRTFGAGNRRHGARSEGGRAHGEGRNRKHSCGQNRLHGVSPSSLSGP